MIAIFCKLEQELFFVAAVRYVPDMARQKMTVRAGHGAFSLMPCFIPSKVAFKP